MGKRSGWANWKGNYDGRRATDSLYRGRRSFGRWVEESRGPIAAATWDNGLVDYDDSGRIAVQRPAVVNQASELVRQSKDASYPKNYLVKLAQDQAAAGGARLSDRQAENRINREQAARAEAILLSAKVGRIRLARAQRERLDKIADGQYLDLIYGRYKSGDRGTLVGVKTSPDRRGRDEQSRENYRQFRQAMSQRVRGGVLTPA